MTPKGVRIKRLGIFAALGLAGVLLTMSFFASRSSEPVEVVGELSGREVAEIRVALWRRTHPPILPDLSFHSVRGAPTRVWERVAKSDAKLFRIEARTPVFAAVITRLPTNSVGNRYVLWCAFKGTNRWWIGDAYYLKNYPNH